MTAVPWALARLRGVAARQVLLGPELAPVADGWLQFEGDRITQIGRGRPPPGVLDLGEGTALPGLVDCHVHLTMRGSADIPAEVAALDSMTATLTAVANAGRQLASGVTTLRDLGSWRHLAVGLSQPAERLGLLLPTVVAAAALAPPGGHGHFLSTLASGPDQFGRAVHDAVDAGARAVKIFATGGVITPGTVPGSPQMTPEEIAAVVEAAHGRGVPVAAHAHGGAGILAAARAGVDSIEHFSYLDDATVAVVAESGRTLVSTLVATERFVAAPGIDQADPEASAKIRAHAPSERAALRLAVRTGLPLAVGTDAGTTFNPHGGGMAEQAEHLAAAGLAPRRILLALTAAGARLLGQPAGILAPGQRADVLMVAGDPTTDVTALRRVRAVIARGLLAVHHDLPGQR
jgi:imidazolonepropionase-like amidohydrolase